jgi:hypothetical protein
LFKRLIEIIFFGSIFISVCVVALCIETALLLHLPLNSFSFYLLVFGAALLQYNLHYHIKKSAIENSRRLIWSLQNKSIHKILIAIGIVFIIIGLLDFPLHHFIILLLFGAISFFYSFPFLPFPNKKRIKDFGLLKIITLALMWTLVTVWFPVNDIFFTGTAFQLIFLRRFIFIFVLCLLFDIRDTEIDRKDNISTLAIIIGIEKCYRLIYILLAIFVMLSLGQFIFITA